MYARSNRASPPTPNLLCRDAGEKVTLVDKHDRVVGEGLKLDVHRRGLLHRAFSLLVTDHSGRLLLQRRASGKYHFPGCWSNACCGHPRPGEQLAAAARRRLFEELRIETALSPLFELRYRARDPFSGLYEHEYLHVLQGRYASDVDVDPDPAEVDAWRWVEPAALHRELELQPNRFTPWFRLLMGLPEAGDRQCGDDAGPAARRAAS